MGRRVALATRHGKELILAPVFSEILGWDVEVADVDTDAFGTFSGDIPRLLAPRETALAKAARARDKNGVSLGIASEGSIGPHPVIPLVNADVELIACVDVELGMDFVETYSSTNIVAVRSIWGPDSDIDEICARADLPRHAVIVTHTGDAVRWVQKGLRERDDVLRAISECSRAVTDAQVVIESDFRAMCSPTRQENIRECALKFAQRLATLCPECAFPGWGPVSVEYGVACRGCGETVMDAVRADVNGCANCDAREVVSRGLEWVDPVRCPVCNP